MNDPINDPVGDLEEALSWACDNCDTPGLKALMKKHGFGDGCPECHGTRFPDDIPMSRKQALSLLAEIYRLREAAL